MEQTPDQPRRPAVVHLTSALAQHYRREEVRLDGWTVAQSYSEVGREIPDPALREYALKLAVHAVLRRAGQLVGPIRPARRMVREPLTEGFRGEINVERSLENLLGKEFPARADWIVERRENKHLPLVLMMDVSLSMAGRNLALAAVAAAVLALKIPEEDLAVVAFDNTARALTRLGEPHPVETVVRLILSQPARGFTNIAEALEVGHRESLRSRGGRPIGLIITDGVYTVGTDPARLAARFHRLFVLLTEDYKMNEDLCRRMARAGRGDVFRVKGFEELPERMLDIAHRVLR